MISLKSTMILLGFNISASFIFENLCVFLIYKSLDFRGYFTHIFKAIERKCSQLLNYSCTYFEFSHNISSKKKRGEANIYLDILALS